MIDDIRKKKRSTYRVTRTNILLIGVEGIGYDISHKTLVEVGKDGVQEIES